MTAPCWLLSVHLLLLHDVTSTRDGNLTRSARFTRRGVLNSRIGSRGPDGGAFRVLIISSVLFKDRKRSILSLIVRSRVPVYSS